MNQEERWLLEEKYNGRESDEFHADCMRLAVGEPLAYLIGTVPFLDCTIHLDSRPLIPRPETEYLTKCFIDEVIGEAQATLEILDLCAGSGCIGVAIARSIPRSRITFAEIEEEHLSTIKKNLQINYPLSENDTPHTVIQSDLYTHVTGRYDHIISNPPYIDPALDRTTESVRTYEPKTALYGGSAGLDIIAQIIAQGPDYLKRGGTLWVEHEPEQIETIIELVSASDFARCETHNDQYQTPRFTVCTMAL